MGALRAISYKGADALRAINYKGADALRAIRDWIWMHSVLLEIGYGCPPCY